MFVNFHHVVCLGLEGILSAICIHRDNPLIPRGDFVCYIYLILFNSLFCSITEVLSPMPIEPNE